MNTAQDLLQQPSIIVVLAGLFILTAIILFVVPTLSWLFDKLKSSSPKKTKDQAKETPAKATGSDLKIPSMVLNTKQIAYGLIIIVAVVVVGVGGWYVYNTFFDQPKEQTGQSKPNPNLQYSIVGSVKNVDYETGSLTVSDEFTGKDYTLQKNALTKVFRDSQEGLFTEIREGDLVSVASNADFADEQVNIFEVHLIAPGTGL